jgi:CheY-like chemotaxis protein
MSHAAEPAFNASVSPRRILLVEDNPADVALFHYALSEHGILDEVEVFDHGDVAMAFARREGRFQTDRLPDVIVLDLNLPGFDGLQILETLRANPLFNEIPIGIFSSSDDPKDRRRGMELGADFHIEKPVDLKGVEILASTVGELLAGRFR